MSSALKKLSKQIEAVDEDKPNQLQSSVVRDYCKEFDSWLSGFFAQQKWTIKSQKQVIFKFIHNLLKMCKSEKNAIITNIPFISNIMKKLVMPGNDPEIRKEIISASFDIINLSFENSVPYEFWKEDFFAVAFPFNPTRGEKQILQIGDPRDMTTDDVCDHILILINKIEGARDDKKFTDDHFYYWWCIFSASLIPHTIGSKTILSEEQRLQMESKFIHLFIKNIENDVSFFFGKVTDPRALENPLVNRELLHTSLLILEKIMDRIKQKQSEFSKYSNYLYIFFKKTCHVYAVYPGNHKVVDFQIIKHLVDKYKFTNDLFARLECSPTDKLQTLIETIKKFDDRFNFSLIRFFSIAFSYYIHVFLVIMKNFKLDSTMTLSLTHQHFLVMAMAKILMSIPETRPMLPKVLFRYDESSIMITVNFFFALLFNIKDFTKDEFKTIFQQKIPAQTPVIELMQLYTSFLSFEHFTISIKNKKMVNLNAITETYSNIPKNTTETLQNTSFLTDSTRFFLYPSELRDMSVEEINLLVDKFLEYTDIVMKFIGQLTFNEMWIFMLKKYTPQDEVDTKFKKMGRDFKDVIVHAVDSLSSSSQSTKLYILRSLCALMSNRFVYETLGTETQYKFLSYIIPVIKSEKPTPLTSLFTSTAIDIMNSCDIKTFSFLESLANSIVNVPLLTMTETLKSKFALAMINIVTILASEIDEKSPSCEQKKEVLNKVAQKADEFFLNLLCIKSFKNTDRMHLLAFIYVILIIKFNLKSEAISIFASIIPFMSVSIINLFPLICEMAKDIENVNPSYLNAFVKPLEEVKTNEDPEFVDKPEKMYYFALFSALLLLQYPNVEQIRETSISILTANYNNENKGLSSSRGYNLYQTTFEPSYVFYDLSKEIFERLTLISTTENKNSFAFTVKTGTSDHVFELELENHDQLNLLEKKNLFIAHPVREIEEVLFPQMQPETLESKSFLSTYDAGIILYADKGQKYFREIVLNQMQNTSKSFVEFVKSLGILKKNSKVEHTFYVYKTSPIILPYFISDLNTYRKKEAAEALGLSPNTNNEQELQQIVDKWNQISNDAIMNCHFFIIWDNSGGTFLPAHKRLSSAHYIIVLRPIQNNLVYVNVFRTGKAKIGPLMHNMFLSKDIIPLFLRWTILSFCFSRNTTAKSQSESSK